MTQSAIGELWHRTSILTAIAIVAMGWTLNVDAQNQAQKTATVGELGDVLARVNDKPILTKTLFPGAPAETKINQYQLRSRIDRAIHSELVAQKAVALGLDKDPKYLEQVAVVALQVARQEKQMLVPLYLQTIPEIEDAMNREGYKPTAEEIAAHIAQNPDGFAQYPEDIRERMAATQLTDGSRGAVNSARSKWLRQRLSKVKFTLRHGSGDGEALPAAVIEDAVAIDGTAVLLPKIREIVAMREAKQRRVAPSAIKKDVALLTAALSAVVVEADGKSLTLGKLPQLAQLIARLDKNGSVQPLVFKAVTNLIIAADAREAGIDKDPRFIEQQARLAQAVEKGRPKMLAEFYYARQGMSPDDMAASDEDVRSEYNFFMTTMKTRPIRNSADQQDAIRKHIEVTRLKAVRAAHLEMLRKVAEIEYLIEIP